MVSWRSDRFRRLHQPPNHMPPALKSRFALQLGDDGCAIPADMFVSSDTTTPKAEKKKASNPFFSTIADMVRALNEEYITDAEKVKLGTTNSRKRVKRCERTFTAPESTQTTYTLIRVDDRINILKYDGLKDESKTITVLLDGKTASTGDPLNGLDKEISDTVANTLKEDSDSSGFDHDNIYA